MDKKSFWFSILKGVIITVVFSLICILLFALLISLFSITNDVIKPVNVLIKSLAIFTGCFFSLTNSKGLLGGILIGLFGSIMCVLLYGIIGGFSLSINLLWELLLGICVGGISGIITVNSKSKNR